MNLDKDTKEDRVIVVEIPVLRTVSFFIGVDLSIRALIIEVHVLDVIVWNQRMRRALHLLSLSLWHGVVRLGTKVGSFLRRSSGLPLAESLGPASMNVC